MDRIYRVGVVGCGRMGATIDDEVSDRPDAEIFLPYSHAAAAVACERTRLVAVADVAEDRLAAACARYEVPRGYLDYREMIERQALDIVCVATRPASHLDIIRFAGEQGVPAVYCEKPLCGSLEEADAIVDVVERAGMRFAYGTQRRYAPLYTAARAWIEAGHLGEIQAVLVYFGSGSALWTHTHTADLLLFFTADSPVAWVQGESAWTDQDWEGEALTRDPPIVGALIAFQGGARGYLTSASGAEVEVVGSGGRLRIESNGRRLRVWDRDRWGSWRPGAPPAVTPESGTLHGLRALAGALDGGPPVGGSARVARAGLELLFAALESHRRGGLRVECPPARGGLRVAPPGW